MAANRKLEKELEQATQAALQGHLASFIAGGAEVSGVTVVTGEVPDADMPALRTLGESLRDRMGPASVGVLGSRTADKAFLVVSVSDDVIARGVQAGKLVGSLAKRVGGGGGGRPNLATAGGRNPDGLSDALAASASIVRLRP